MSVPIGLNFLMWNFSAVKVWLKLFPGSHKISCDCNTEIQLKRRSISCMFDDLCVPHLLLYISKHAEHTSLGFHIPFLLLSRGFYNYLHLIYPSIQE